MKNPSTFGGKYPIAVEGKRGNPPFLPYLFSLPYYFKISFPILSFRQWAK
jgi:hypothetical protein